MECTLLFVISNISILMNACTFLYFTLLFLKGKEFSYTFLLLAVMYSVISKTGNGITFWNVMFICKNALHRFIAIKEVCRNKTLSI